MRKPISFGAIALGAIAVVGVLAGAWYFASRDSELTSDRSSAAHEPGSGATPATSAARAPERADTIAALPDPRLQALTVSPDNGLIEFVKSPDGRVIMEIDRDPASARFGKPAREYTYLGNQVVALTTYKPLGDQLQVSRITVSFRPDGSVEEFRETTDYEPLRKSP